MYGPNFYRVEGLWGLILVFRTVGVIIRKGDLLREIVQIGFLIYELRAEVS